MGPAHSDRETLYSNGSLLIQNVTRNDTGTYAVRILWEGYVTYIASTEFHVHQPVTPPFIQVTNTTIKEKDPVSLTCISKDTGISIRWLFNGKRLELTDRMKLSQDNITLRIESFRKEDSGVYECEVSNPVSSKKSDSIQLDIMHA
ncbi:carcinoembryonic antigen-related cell adhesion molecule 3-like [Cricetulus griseus]|uniref:Carcinoembryonic antigen-related cell adhesion molecule 3-like n=1 Tax=Cricetulus griseus TaxID=10029 RepID=A0A061HVU2_CRIGR|nr:carcinoembryonic antigen-related cell adhesion molecule 3-like [Cricetulus griseus]XP_035315690.1 carcinoembryonic antigen-related cell adhesion molecule 3-like [Cricetulus griseus]ERE52560.1 carcinoembryonic antigen-related cell adhesion molecule 3-like protein [Cricetulus griseus]